MAMNVFKQRVAAIAWTFPVRLITFLFAFISFNVGFGNIDDGANYQSDVNTAQVLDYCSGIPNGTATFVTDCFLVLTPFRGADNIAVALILLTAVFLFRVREACMVLLFWQLSPMIMVNVRGNLVPSDVYRSGAINRLTTLQVVLVVLSMLVGVPSLAFDLYKTYQSSRLAKPDM